MPRRRRLPDQIANPRFDISRLFAPTFEDLARTFGTKIADDIISRIRKAETRPKLPLSTAILHFIFRNGCVSQAKILELHPPSLQQKVKRALAYLERRGRVKKKGRRASAKYSFAKFA